MNICIPVLENKGLESPVSAHFGSAPLFMVVDTESANCRPVLNRNLHHGHGMCQPLLSLAGENLDGIVVGGIGMGALRKLQAANIRVYLSMLPTIEATLAAFKAGTLEPVTPETACGGHGERRQGQTAGSQGCHGQGRSSL
jgi:predicted Fe-Mo cluster-binding NifX family protein